MNIGVFLLIEPFASVEVQLQKAKEMGFRYADITDTSSGATMLGTAGFSPVVSLDDNPFDVKRLFDKYGIKITTVCAHANLLDPTIPSRYSTADIMKAVKFASAIGVREVVTTDSEPHSEWAKKTTFDQKVFTCAEKLLEPVRLAEEYGVRIAIEPHGPVSCSIEGIQGIMDLLGNPKAFGVNLDTGNSWLGGTDPVAMAKAFKDKIFHVHWKDLGEEWVEKRGTQYGCGFSTIALGDGVVDIKGVCDVLKDTDCKNSTLEIVGSADILKRSVDYLRSCGL
jgi:inosose dehydratase